MSHRPTFIILIFLIIVLLASCTPSAPAPSKTGVSGQAELSPAPAPTQAPEPTPAPTISDEWGVYQENAEAVVADGFYIVALTDGLKERITGKSFPEGEAEITYDDLRYIRLKYWDFEGEEHEDGELIVSEQLAREVAGIFYALYEAKYPFTSIRLVDDFGEPGDDNLSMAANNTSAFNYRFVTGTDTLSLHSYGDAIDINPMLNPYIDGERVAPENGAAYADRTLGLPGMIGHDDLCYKLFTENGLKGGGDWDEGKDYQHFSKNVES